MKSPTRLKVQDQNKIVASLLVPVQNKSLLVPNVAIAEVVSIQNIEPAKETPPWCIGWIEWRGEHLPVLSFEIANSQVKGRDSHESRLAIFNSVNASAKRRFFAMIVQGIPRMIKLSDAEVREDTQAVKGQAEQMSVITQLGKAVIPDIDYLETLANRV